MNKPTIEELEGYPQTTIGGLVNQEYLKSVAVGIHSAYNPTLKPLSDLHKDEESCRKVFEFVFKNQGTVVISQCNDGIEVEQFENGDSLGRMIIKFNGELLLFDWMGEEMKANCFQIVDFIRSIGYDVQPENKTT